AVAIGTDPAASETRARSNPQHAIVIHTILLVWTAIALTWFLYLVRQALLVIYVSVVLAIGFSPLVRMVEHQRWLSVGAQRFVPRWLAILIIYSTILALVLVIGFFTLPILIGQGQELWTQLPILTVQVQRLLMKYPISKGLTLDRIIDGVTDTSV